MRVIFVAIVGRLYPSLPLPAMPVTHNVMMCNDEFAAKSLQICWLGNLSLQSYAKVNPPFSVGIPVPFAVEKLAAATSRTLGNFR